MRPLVASMRSRRAVTLIELVAVLVLLGLAFAALAPGLAGANAAARQRAMRSELINLDRLARRAALGGGAWIVLASDARAVRVVLPDATVLSEVPIPEASSVTLADAESGSEIRSIDFDSAGRSRPYRVEVRSRAVASSWLVSGITGWRTEVDP